MLGQVQTWVPKACMQRKGRLSPEESQVLWVLWGERGSSCSNLGWAAGRGGMGCAKTGDGK